MRMMTTQETRYLFRRRNRRKGKRGAVRMTMKITVMRVLNMRMRARRRKSLAKVEANY